MTATNDTRADSTRQQILRAAARRFARQPYHQVSLEHVLVDAELTKGAMYFHFPSKLALAVAVIEDQMARSSAALLDLVARKVSGLETLIDFSFQVAVRDITEETPRAALHLLESIGRIEDLQVKPLGAWVDSLAVIIGRAIGEGDVFEDCDPQDVGRLLVSTYIGLRQAGDLDQPEKFLREFETTWTMSMPGFVRPERIAYFRQFVGRRTAIAIGNVTALAASTS